jgi:hypothetical protein
VNPVTALPDAVMLAFQRLAESPPETPNWSRTVRLAVDYALRVAGPADADAFAYNCYVLGQLQACDPVGDPPATCTAHTAAQQAGPQHASAFSVLGQLRDTQATLREHGLDVQDLPRAAWDVLQQAARGERIADEEALDIVLDQARRLTSQLSLRAIVLPLSDARPATQIC